ncbi:MAG: aminopeptidase P family protein [Proteobacteria bacterium]|jgi:Xaa-Pro aminopeptidase|nr:aminopeptidase P family protein [Pseudomonadota bacterium]
MRKPLESPQIFQERRKRLAELIPGAALIMAAPQEQVRNGSVHFPFRQDSNLYYFTGFEEPETVLIFRAHETPQTVLFVRKKNPEMETWDGFRFGPEATESEFKIDKVYPIDEFDKVAPELLKGIETIYYRLYQNPAMDKKFEAVLKQVQSLRYRAGHGYPEIKDTKPLMAQLRVRKTEAEIRNLREAGEISAQSHFEVMKYTRPGMTEREVHGYFIYQALKRGAAREGYNGIVAGGPNACTLHYVFNDQKLKAGDLLLIDCGAEYNYYTGDITRTFPIGGRFTDEQAEVYEGVLKVQKQLIEHVKPGIPFQEFHELGADLLTDLMFRLGLLAGRKEDAMKALEHKKYYPHGIGHFLGMDVHDLGYYKDLKGEPIRIEENMVFTIEPGLYIPANDQVAAPKYRGIGVRIEDNIRVTAPGHENLTVAAPKEISDLEKVIGIGPS